MNIKKIAKIAAFMALIVVATSCLEKNDSLSFSPTLATADSNKEWQWDDGQKNWLHHGAVYTPKTDSSMAALWKKQENAIIFRVESPKSLTAFDNAPNALQLKLFQLSDPKAFLQVAKSSNELKHFLLSEQTEPTVVSVERLFVLPGVSQTLNLGRKDNARYIGVVLGYANQQPDKLFRLIPIVTLEEETASNNNNSAAGNGVAPNPQMTLRPATLKINLSLAGDGINKLDVDAW